ncbi:MAG: GIY-YIG nuclease family protein [Oscillospiraceae bacterium]|nr:GIY-YIG nuclease family protein [Oscillospiraceae bacterium]
MGQIKKGYVYLLFNRRNGTLYSGVTSNLVQRVYQHKNKLIAGFTCNYNIDKLGYYEVFDLISDAIAREKQIKAGSRESKLELIERSNPNWNDLYNEII